MHQKALSAYLFRNQLEFVCVLLLQSILAMLYVHIVAILYASILRVLSTQTVNVTTNGEELFWISFDLLRSEQIQEPQCQELFNLGP